MIGEWPVDRWLRRRRETEAAIPYALRFDEATLPARPPSVEPPRMVRWGVGEDEEAARVTAEQSDWSSRCLEVVRAFEARDLAHRTRTLQAFELNLACSPSTGQA